MFLFLFQSIFFMYLYFWNCICHLVIPFVFYCCAGYQLLCYISCLFHTYTWFILFVNVTIFMYFQIFYFIFLLLVFHISLILYFISNLFLVPVFYSANNFYLFYFTIHYECLLPCIFSWGHFFLWILPIRAPFW